MHPFTVLGDPVRRRLVEELSQGQRSAGDLVRIVGAEFGITQSAVSQHLQVLREAGFASVKAEGRRRVYSIEPLPLKTISAWLTHYGAFWERALDDLAGEVEAGASEREGRKPN